MTTTTERKPHWLCRIGWHRWMLELRPGSSLDDETPLYMERCTRPGCPRGEWEEV